MLAELRGDDLINGNADMAFLDWMRSLEEHATCAFVGSDFAKNNGWFARVVMTLIKPVARSPRKGAESGIYLCTSPEVDGKTGGYYYNCAINKTRSAARNDEDAKRLWELSEQYAAGWPAPV